VLCKDVILHRGRFCTRSLAWYIPRSSKDRSSWMFFIQVVCGCPGARLQFSEGGSKFKPAFSAFALLVRCQEEHPSCKNWVMGFGMIICLDWGAYCLHMVQLMPLHPKTPSSLTSFKTRLVFLFLPFWYWLTQVVVEKRPLNGCNSSSSSIYLF